MGMFLMAIFTGVPVVVGTILVILTFRHWIQQARLEKLKGKE